MNFTKEDWQRAFKEGIFARNNEVTASATQVVHFFQKWAKKKCQDTALNVTAKVMEIYYEKPAKDLERLVHNITDADVLPE